MAIIGTDENENAPTTSASPNAVAGPGAPVVGGGGGFAGGGKGAGQGATTTVATPGAQGAGGYTNLMSYLGANQGAGSQMAQGVENVVNGAGQQADSALTQYGTDAANEINSSAVNVDPNVVAQINAGVNKGTYTAPTGVNLNPTSTTPSDVSQLTGTPATEQAGAYSQIQNLVGGAPGSGTYTGGLVGNATGGQAGLSSVLGNDVYNEGNSNYTPGESGLDSFLTSSSGGWQQAQQAMQQQWGGEGAKADALNTQLNQDATNAAATTQATGQTYANDVNAAENQAATYSAPTPVLPKEVYTPVSQGTHTPIPKEVYGGVTQALRPPTALQTTNAANPLAVNDRQTNAANPLAASTTQPNAISPLNYAQGGQVPSYAQLLKMLSEEKRA